MALALHPARNIFEGQKRRWVNKVLSRCDLLGSLDGGPAAPKAGPQGSGHCTKAGTYRFGSGSPDKHIPKQTGGELPRSTCARILALMAASMTAPLRASCDG
jgi:hypothetical protein